MDSQCYFSFILVFLFAVSSFIDCYDPLDPNGNVTVAFDILQWTHDGYVGSSGENAKKETLILTARVSIENYYQYRHINKPGWKLGFTWSNKEVIWSITGAIATQQGNCSSFKDEIPHCCISNPQIVDLINAGVLTARAINAQQSSSSFNMVVGNLQQPLLQTPPPPVNLTLLAPGPGYTCSPLEDTKPTLSLVTGGIREEQVFRTWKSTCTYSSFLANRTPVCCVSLSTFYNPQITTCPQCSCGCRPANKKTSSCIISGSSVETEFIGSKDTVRCSNHMCPLRVHWHIKNNYKNQWRVKLTVTNLNYDRNYSNWNLLVNHPGFGPAATTYSFNTTLLHTAGIPDDVALFWGIDYFNTDLLNADKDGSVGSVSTEMVLTKDPTTFTLHNGWGFPRSIYFGGENCVMPPPHTFPMLPNAIASTPPSTTTLIILLFLLLVQTF